MDLPNLAAALNAKPGAGNFISRTVRHGHLVLSHWIDVVDESGATVLTHANREADDSGNNSPSPRLGQTQCGYAVTARKAGSPLARDPRMIRTSPLTARHRARSRRTPAMARDGHRSRSKGYDRQDRSPPDENDDSLHPEGSTAPAARGPGPTLGRRQGTSSPRHRPCRRNMARGMNVGAGIERRVDGEGGVEALPGFWGVDQRATCADIEGCCGHDHPASKARASPATGGDATEAGRSARKSSIATI
jgi:hypothetical protein